MSIEIFEQYCRRMQMPEKTTHDIRHDSLVDSLIRDPELLGLGEPRNIFIEVDGRADLTLILEDYTPVIVEAKAWRGRNQATVPARVQLRTNAKYFMEQTQIQHIKLVLYGVHERLDRAYVHQADLKMSEEGAVMVRKFRNGTYYVWKKTFQPIPSEYKRE